MADLTQETVDIINGQGFNTNGAVQSPEEILRQIGYYSANNNILNNNAGMLQYMQMLLEQSNREVDYNRTNPVAVAYMLQAAGMSRAAALEAASGHQAATSGVSPYQPIPTDISSAIDIASTAFGAVGTIASVAALPAEIAVKKSTADLINNQSGLLADQREGMALANAVYQTAANNGFDFKGKNASDLMQFLTDKGHDISKFRSNPYGVAQLSSMMTQEYQTAAQSYSPEMAHTIQRVQAATEGLVRSQDIGQKFMNRHLNRVEDIEQACQSLRKAASVAQANSERYQYMFDAKRFEKFYERVSDFTSLDLMQLDYDISQLRYRGNVKLWKHETDALVNSYDYQAAQYLFAYHLQQDMSRTYEDYAERDESGIPKGQVFKPLMERLVLYNTLDKQGQTDNLYRWLKLGLGTAAGLGAGALGAAKFLVPLAQASRAVPFAITNSGFVGTAGGAAAAGGSAAAIGNLTLPLMTLMFTGDTSPSHAYYPSEALDELKK